MPNSFDTTHQLFSGILQFVPRITLASIFVSLLVQRVDCRLYGFLKKRFAGKYLVTRNIFSIFCTQLLDTVLFSFAGLYGIVGSIFSVMTLSFVIKIVVIFVATPFVVLSKKIVQKYVFFEQGAVLDFEKNDDGQRELRG